MMNSYFDQVEQTMGDAVERLAHKPWHVRLLHTIRRHPGPAVVLATLVVATPAVGAVTNWYGLTSVQFHAEGLLDPKGNPKPAVNSYPDGAGSVIHWSMCSPGTSKCTALSSTSGTADPGPQPAGTIFKVTARWDGQTHSSSVRWQGALHVAMPPTLSGAARVGARVTVAPARWTGGWRTGKWTAPHDDLGIEACRTTRATDCVMLAGAAVKCSAPGCGEEGGVVGTTQAPDFARVGNWYTGWYLFGLDAHLSAGLSFGVGYSSPAAIKPWPTNDLIVRSRPYGPVAGPPAPKVAFLPRARAHGSQQLVATIRCVVRCPVAVSVRLKHPIAGQRSVWAARQVVKGIRPVGVSGGLPAGPVIVSIRVGNGPYVTGRSLVN